jgi:hypothetical protein
LRVSDDGKTVQLGTTSPEHLARFALAERRLDFDLPTDDALAAPVTEASDLKVTAWLNDYQPALNGRPIALERYEASHRLALLLGKDGFILGAEWSVRRFDREGTPVWAEPVPGPTWRVNVTPDRRLVVSAHSDGTIRW